MNIDHRSDRQFPGGSQLSPDQHSIRVIKVQTPPLVRLDHCLRIIAEELIEVVQVSEGFRMDIRSVQGAVCNLIPARELKLAIKVTSSVG